MASVYIYNDMTYGEEHADRYMAFLEARLQELADSPGLGHDVDGFPAIKVAVAKSKKRRQTHGHRVLYRVVPQGIEVIRVLHTSMDWPDHLA